MSGLKLVDNKSKTKQDVNKIEEATIVEEVDNNSSDSDADAKPYGLTFNNLAYINHEFDKAYLACRQEENKHVKFQYFLIKNKKSLEPLQKLLEDNVKDSERYIEYIKEARKINQEVSRLAEKDEEGNPIIENGIYKLSNENLKIINDKGDKIKEEYMDGIQEQEELNKKNKEFLDSPADIDIDFHSIHINDIPDGFFSIDALTSLINLGIVKED